MNVYMYPVKVRHNYFLTQWTVSNVRSERLWGKKIYVVNAEISSSVYIFVNVDL